MIKIAVGYVTSRRNARLHLNVGGVAHCHSGSQRIIIAGSLNEHSAIRICRHCVAALHPVLVRHASDLYSFRTALAAAERMETEALLSSMRKLGLEPAAVRAACRELAKPLADTVDRLTRCVESRTRKPFTYHAPEPTDSDDQMTLF